MSLSLTVYTYKYGGTWVIMGPNMDQNMKDKNVAEVLMNNCWNECIYKNNKYITAEINT